MYSEIGSLGFFWRGLIFKVYGLTFDLICRIQSVNSKPLSHYDCLRSIYMPIWQNIGCDRLWYSFFFFCSLCLLPFSPYIPLMCFGAYYLFITLSRYDCLRQHVWMVIKALIHREPLTSFLLLTWFFIFLSHCLHVMLPTFPTFLSVHVHIWVL